MMRITRSLLLGLCVAFPGILGAPENAPKVIASIKPVQSLVAGVMQGIGKSALLLKGGASPHDYSLRPSDVRAINDAQVVFWIGEDLETFLLNPLKNTKARSVQLMEAPGVERLAMREGGIWAAHEHQNREHNNDPHIWLDPQNAEAMIRDISTTLAEVDPAHKELYAENATVLVRRLEDLDRELNSRLEPIKDRPYIVFHDAYQYFEHHYGLAAAGSITVSPEQKPGARRIQEIRERIRNTEVVCVFSEPQFEPGLVRVLIENTSARSGVLDPLGTQLPEGPDTYFELLTNLAVSLKRCLEPKS